MSLRPKSIAIIGGGAAGLAAAVTAARSGANVMVFEAQDRVGNTIKVTGDGRCNIANAGTRADVYHNAAFAAHAFEACSPAQSITFLESLGLLLREEAEGRLYPYTNKATSVIDALRLAAAHAGVREVCAAQVASVLSPKADEWRVVFSDGSSQCFDAVVLACGGNVASSLLPGDVAFCDTIPLLGPLATNTEPLRGLDKVRAKCALSSNGHREVGEVTFRAYGISGIAAFNMTRFVQPGDALTIDFLPDFESDSLAFLTKRMEALRPATWLEFTCGMLLPLLARAVLRAAGLGPDDCPDERGMDAFNSALRAFPLRVRGIGDKKLCQVHRGGVDVSAVDPATMQIQGHAGLYATGEMLDVDGPCGGYNLHWAWVCGILAGQAAARVDSSTGRHVRD